MASYLDSAEKDLFFTALPGYPGSSGGKAFYLQCRRPGFDPWRREWYSCPPSPPKTRGSMAHLALLVAQKVKRLLYPAVRETRVQSLGREDPLEKGNSTPFQYSGLENSMDRGAW